MRASSTSFTVLFSILATVEALPKPKTEAVWPGWEGIKDMFVFGDSYTTTGFNVTLEQPNPANPLGNPAYPGYTASNGPNWIDFLTTTYNASYIQTYNLAYGGATVDATLVQAYLPTVLSMKQQIQDEYLPYYGSDNSSVAWKSDSSLFALFIGINDVGNSYQERNASLHGIIFNEYAALVEQLYASGARNFLFQLVPPVQRSPLTTATNATFVALEKAAIMDWNSRVKNMIATLEHKHKDVTAFVYDTYDTFNRVLDNPSSYPQTAGYKNTTAYCDAYMNGTPTWYTFNATCGIPVNEYFWLNSLHPTFPMHNATAATIVEQLKRKSRGHY